MTMTNLPATQSTLEQQISTLTEKLAPIGADHVSDTMASLIKAGLLFPSSVKADDAKAVYSYALANASAHGLRVVASKLIRGEYENINRAFIPTPPEIAAMVRAETRTIVEDLARLKAKREALAVRPPEKRNQDTIDRIRAMRQAYKQAHEASKGISEAAQEEISDEKADYYRRIMCLKDAPGGVTAEQAAFRRSIANRFPEDERKAAE